MVLRSGVGVIRVSCRSPGPVVYWKQAARVTSKVGSNGLISALSSLHRTDDTTGQAVETAVAHKTKLSKDVFFADLETSQAARQWRKLQTEAGTTLSIEDVPKKRPLRSDTLRSEDQARIVEAFGLCCRCCSAHQPGGDIPRHRQTPCSFRATGVATEVHTTEAKWPRPAPRRTDVSPGFLRPSAEKESMQRVRRRLYFHHKRRNCCRPYRPQRKGGARVCVDRMVSVVANMTERERKLARNSQKRHAVGQEMPQLIPIVALCQDYEVLYMVDPLDEICSQSIVDYEALDMSDNRA